MINFKHPRNMYKYLFIFQSFNSCNKVASVATDTVFTFIHHLHIVEIYATKYSRYMAEILPIRRKLYPINQPINQSINQSIKQLNTLHGRKHKI